MKTITITADQLGTEIAIERNGTIKRHKKVSQRSRRRLERLLEHKGTFSWHVIGMGHYTVRFTYRGEK